MIAVVVAGALVMVDAVDQHRSGNDATDSAAAVTARPDIVAATSGEVSALLSYNYKTLPKDFATAEAGLTPSFKASYIHETQTQLEGPAKRLHAVTKASVVSAGVVTNTATTATVLAFIDQTSTNSELSNSRLDRSRARITLEKINGKWLLNSLTTL